MRIWHGVLGKDLVTRRNPGKCGGLILEQGRT